MKAQSCIAVSAALGVDLLPVFCCITFLVMGILFFLFFFPIDLDLHSVLNLACMNIFHSKICWFQDLENYILELIPTLPQLSGLERTFYSFYVCTAVRKFFFFLDPLRTGRIKIQDILACSFLDDLLEVVFLTLVL